MQAIVDRLAGIPTENLPPPGAFDQPWRTIYRRVTRAIDQKEAASLIWQATERLGDHEARLQWLADLVFLLPADDQFRPFPSLREMSAGLRDVYRARQALSSLIVDLGSGPHDPRKRWTLAQLVPSPDEST
jgi:hypothetical protein